MSEDLRVLQVSKRFGEAAALAEVELALTGGQYVCVMGASGSGKSTLLRIIAGLEGADVGEVWVGERRIDRLAAERRPTRTAAQSPALFPHLSVLENVTFVDRVRRWRGPAAVSGEALLGRMGLDPGRFAGRRVGTLSGGERQRVALARTLYRAPPWLLLDEPLSALDRPLRAELRRALALARAEAGVGVVHVSHEAEDALALADLLVVFDAGRVIAAGDPVRLYQRPADQVTARLLGELSPCPDPARRGWIRPERLQIVGVEEGRVRGRIVGRAFAGQRWEVEVLSPSGARIVVFRAEPWQGPEACGLQWDDEDLLVWPTEA